MTDGAIDGATDGALDCEAKEEASDAKSEPSDMTTRAKRRETTMAMKVENDEVRASLLVPSVASSRRRGTCVHTQVFRVLKVVAKQQKAY